MVCAFCVREAHVIGGNEFPKLLAGSMYLLIIQVDDKCRAEVLAKTKFV